MKKTLQDVLNDIQDKLIGKELHGISGTASAFRISEIDNEKNILFWMFKEKEKHGLLKEWKGFGKKCIIVQQQMLR